MCCAAFRSGYGSSYLLKPFGDVSLIFELSFGRLVEGHPSFFSQSLLLQGSGNITRAGNITRVDGRSYPINTSPISVRENGSCSEFYHISHNGYLYYWQVLVERRSVF